MNSRSSQSIPAGSWGGIFRDLIATWRLLGDPSVPGLLKLILPFLALVYWISPLDLLPGLPFDDIAVLLVAARLFVTLAPQASVNRAFNRGGAQAPRPDGQRRRADDDGDVIDTTWRVVED